MPINRLRDLAAVHEERRRTPRDDVDFITSVLIGGGEIISVRLVDISPMGFHARSHRQFERGETVTLNLPLVGPVSAQVAWALTGCFGCWVEHKIPIGTYARLLPLLNPPSP